MSTITKSQRRPRLLTAGLLGALMMTTSACAGGFGANDVSRGSVGHASTVRQGTVTSVRQVTIRDNNNGAGTQVATTAGAAIGGLLGSQVGGRGTTQAIGAVGGAVLGGLAGNAVGRAASTSQGLAYTVQFQNGEVREIIQGDDVYIKPGAPVNIIFRPNGVVVAPL